MNSIGQKKIINNSKHPFFRNIQPPKDSNEPILAFKKNCGVKKSHEALNCNLQSFGQTHYGAVNCSAEYYRAIFLPKNTKFKNLSFGSKVKHKNRFQLIKKQLEEKFSDKEIQEGKTVWFSSDAYIQAIKEGGFEVESVEAVGGESAVFNLKDGNILKLSPAKYNLSIQGVNPQEFSRGVINLGDKKQLYYIVQKKVDVGSITPEEFRQLEKAALEQGCLLTDCILQGGIIKQSNFGKYTDENGEEKTCIIDLGALKRMYTRYAYEELLMLNDDTLPEQVFAQYRDRVIIQALDNSKINSRDAEEYYKKFNEIKSDFMSALNIKSEDERNSDIMQKTLCAHDVMPLKEF